MKGPGTTQTRAGSTGGPGLKGNLPEYLSGKASHRGAMVVRGMAVVLAILLVIAGCATAPESAGEPELSEDEAAALFRPLPDFSNRLVHRGITVAAPEGWVFENAWGARPGGEPHESPVGVLFRFRDPDGVVSGSVQYVFVAGGAGEGGEGAVAGSSLFMERYLETHLNGADSTVFAVPVGQAGTEDAGSSAGGSAAYAAFVPTGGGNRDGNGTDGAEMLTILFPLSPRVSDEHGILVEVVFPAGSDTHRAEAAAIAASVNLPQSRGDMRRHGRITGNPAFSGFEDDGGHWLWVTDLPDGMVLRRNGAETDLYLTLAGHVPSESMNSATATGASVEYERGQWRWSLPVAVSTEDSRTRYVRIPPDPLVGLPAFVVTATVPEQRWRGSQPERLDNPEDAEVAQEIQLFMTQHLIPR